MKKKFRTFNSRISKDSLRQIVEYKFDQFDSATENTIKNLNSDIKAYSKIIEGIRKETPINIKEENRNEIIENAWNISDKLEEYFLKYDLAYDSLDSLLEMRIVYLFKCLEITMKKLIEKAYPGTNTKELYKWENMKSYFKTRDIDISKLKGYLECTETRKVSNAIKHNDELGEDIKKIKEFEDDNRFTYNSLNEFYLRVKIKIEEFTSELEIEVEKDLFTFSDERVDKLANEYSYRMSEDKIKLFIKKLNSKLNSKIV